MYCDVNNKQRKKQIEEMSAPPELSEAEFDELLAEMERQLLSEEADGMEWNESRAVQLLIRSCVMHSVQIISLCRTNIWLHV